MPLIDVPEQTLEQKQAALLSDFKGMFTQNYEDLMSLYRTGYIEVWQSPRGLTPQQAFDALGTDAVHYLQIGQAVAALLNAAVPGSVDPTPPQTVTPQEDGTVIVG